MSAPEDRVCGECGAGQGPYAVRCWICKSPLEAAPSADVPAPPPVPAPVPRRRPRTVRHPHSRAVRTGNILVLVVCALLVVGAFFDEPGLGILLLIFMLPAVIGIAQASTEIGKKGGQISTGAMVSALVLAGFVSAGMTFLAAVVAVFVICSGAFDSMDLDGMITVGILIAGAAVIGGLVLASKVARNIALTGSPRPRR